MTPGTAPGVAIFSKEWMAEVAPDLVSGAGEEFIRELCETFQLGNSTDPHTVADLLRKHGALFLSDEEYA